MTRYMHCHKIYVWYKFPLLNQQAPDSVRIGLPPSLLPLPLCRHNHLSHFITAEVISHNTESGRSPVQRGFIWSHLLLRRRRHRRRRAGGVRQICATVEKEEEVKAGMDLGAVGLSWRVLAL